MSFEMTCFIVCLQRKPTGGSADMIQSMTHGPLHWYEMFAVHKCSGFRYIKYRPKYFYCMFVMINYLKCTHIWL